MTNETLSDEEIGRLIHARQELINCIDEWKAHGWNKALAARFSAMDKTLRDEPMPSPAFVNLSKRMAFMTKDDTQAVVNGALLALAWRAGGRLEVPTQDIFAAHTVLGTLGIMITPDDKYVVVTGSKQQ